MRDRIAHSVFWLTWSRGGLQVLSFATTLLVARILEPADYGVMALATLWIGTAGMLAEMGLGSAIVQFRDLDKREIDTCFWITVMLAVGCAAILCLSAPEIAAWFAMPRLAEILPVLSLVLPLTAFRVVSDSLLRKNLALDKVSQAEVIGSIATLPVILGCAIAGFGVWTLVIGAMVNPAMRTVATFAFVPWWPGFRLGGQRVRDVIRFSLTTLGIKVMWLLREWGNPLVIGKISGQAGVLGLYSMAEEIAFLPNHKISTVVNMLSAPVMAELQNDVDRMRASFWHAVRLTAAIALPTSAGMALVADDMVAILLGPKWSPAVPVLRALCLYAGVRSIDVLLPPVLFARRRERFLFWYCLALLILMPTAALLGAVWNGAVGTVIFATPIYCTVMAFMARETLTEMETGFGELWVVLRSIVTATVVMSVAVLLLREIGLEGWLASPLLRLLLLSASGGLVYLGALYYMSDPVITAGYEVIGWILYRRTPNHSVTRIKRRTAAHYRDVAHWLRGVAARCRLPRPQRDLHVAARGSGAHRFRRDRIRA